MYRTCIHCQQPLGSNDAIEALPIGRRLAFDGERGRLWVVCGHCARWNLTPFDARYEAIEQCERAYRDTRVRLSTDNIGLARLRDGTDLVRVGRPLRPEFAAWRYGDQFGRRRQRLIRNGVVGVGIGVAGSAAYAGLLSAGLAVGLASAFTTVMPILNVALGLNTVVRQRKVMIQRMRLEDGRFIAPTGTMRLVELDVPERWGVEASVMVSAHSLGHHIDKWDTLTQQYEVGYETIRGAYAVPLMRRYLPAVNKAGANSSQVREGVQLIEAAGGPDRFGAWAATQRRKWAAAQVQGDSGDFNYIPVAARLAFEMAVNEDAERRALEGELAQLETAWKEAEELAAISDRLTPMQSIEQKLDALRIRRR